MLFTGLVFAIPLANSYGAGQGDNASKMNIIYSNSGLPLPRFVSLAKEKTNVRAGPGNKYPIKWVINRKSLPVEVVLEFDHWRKIIDHDGQEGWVFQSLLSGKRTAITMGKDVLFAYEKPYGVDEGKPRISMRLDPLVVVNVARCLGHICNVSASGFSGWIEKKLLWGVYETENID